MQRHTTQASLNHVRLLLEEGRSEDALLVLQAIATDDEAHQRDVTYLRGWYYILNKQWQDVTHTLSPLLPRAQIAIKDGQQETLVEREIAALHLLHLGQVAIKLAHYEDASQHFALCLRLLHDRRVYFPELRIEVRYQLALTYLARKSYTAALQNYEDALRLCRHYKLNKTVSTIYRDMSEAYEGLGEFGNAQEAAIAALHLFRENGDTFAQVNILHLLGRLSFSLDHYSASEDYYTQSLTLGVSNDVQDLVVCNHVALAELFLKKGDIDGAKGHMRDTLAPSTQTNEVSLCGIVYATLGNVTLAEAHRTEGVERQRLLDEAIARLLQAVPLLESSQSTNKLREVYNTLATVAEELGHEQVAFAYWKLACQKA